ncbi:MAG: hypothetical protein ACTIM4_13590 [Marinomonas sp.]
MQLLASTNDSEQWQQVLGNCQLVQLSHIEKLESHLKELPVTESLCISTTLSLTQLTVLAQSETKVILSPQITRRREGEDFFLSVARSAYVEDRAGHDRRYAIDATKTNNELGYVPAESFETGFAKTLNWYLDNEAWWSELLEADKK